MDNTDLAEGPPKGSARKETVGQKGRWFSRALRGQLKLWQVFYFGLALSICIAIALYKLGVGVVLRTDGMRPFFPIAVAFMPASLPFLAISLWRCSSNVDHFAWTYLARLAAVALAGFIAWWVIATVPDMLKMCTEMLDQEARLNAEFG